VDTDNVREIPLTQGLVALVDAEDIDRVVQHTWCASFQHGKWYALGTVNGKLVYLHRFILRLGPGDPEVDHINDNGLDCRKENMRPATRSENSMNKRKWAGNYSSKYKGVTWDKARRRWIAQIGIYGKHKFLGRFVNEEDAARAYDRAAIEAYGEFAVLNFPREDYVIS